MRLDDVGLRGKRSEPIEHDLADVAGAYANSRAAERRLEEAVARIGIDAASFLGLVACDVEIDPRLRVIRLQDTREQPAPTAKLETRVAKIIDDAHDMHEAPRSDVYDGAV